MRHLFLFVAAGALCAQDPITSRDILNQGVRAFQSAQYPEAVRLFQRAVDLDPSNPIPRLYLATAYSQQYIPGADTPENQQMAARAHDQFQRVLALDPANTVAIGSLASLYLNQKRWNDARAWYGRLITADPTNADAYYSLGFIAWSEWYPAYGQARVKLGMRPETPGPIPDPSVRQDLKTRFGSLLDEGIGNLQKALELNPQYDDAMAYMNLLVRERADLRDTPEEYQREVGEADRWLDQALATKKQRAQGATGIGIGAAPGRIRVGEAVQEQRLIRRVNPVYPPLAQQALIQGIVRLTLLISREGTVANVSVVSGHPLLIAAAIDAAKQWIYQPTLLNGAPVEVVTSASVPFNLDPAVIVK